MADMPRIRRFLFQGGSGFAFIEAARKGFLVTLEKCLGLRLIQSTDVTDHDTLSSLPRYFEPGH